MMNVAETDAVESKKEAVANELSEPQLAAVHGGPARDTHDAEPSHV